MKIDIAEWYSRYGPMVLRRCRCILHDEDAALDALQEVFVKIIEYEGTIDDCYPSSFLYRIATNLCLNIIRNRRKTSEIDSSIESIADDSNHVDRFVYSSTLEEIFSNEKESTREIAVMHYLDGLTLEQVARETGMSVSGVRKRLRLLRKKAHSIGKNE